MKEFLRYYKWLQVFSGVLRSALSFYNWALPHSQVILLISVKKTHES